MAPQVVAGRGATDALVDAIDAVQSEVSYLRAEIGVRPCLEVGTIPGDGEWMRCDELIDNPAWLEAVILATGSRLGTEDPVVAASLFVQNYSYRVLTLAIACLTTSGVVPESSASSMWFALSGGWPSVVGYGGQTVLVVGCQRDALSTALQENETITTVLDAFVTDVLAHHLALLIESTRARIRVGSRLLWGNVAASTAVAFRTMEGCLGPWVRAIGERFFEICPDELKGLGSFLALEFEGRRGWYWERTNCCLYDRLPGNVRCGDCSRTPVDERRSTYLASLQGSG